MIENLKKYEQKSARSSSKKKPKWITEKTLKIAQERREVGTRGDHQRFRQFNAEFQREARRDRQTQLNQEYMIIEENNRKGKTRDLYKKIKN